MTVWKCYVCKNINSSYHAYKVTRAEFIWNHVNAAVGTISVCHNSEMFIFLPFWISHNQALIHSVCFRLSCRSREAQVVAASQRTLRGRERARKPKASLNPQRLLNPRRRNPQINTQVHTGLKHTLYSSKRSNVYDPKKTRFLFSCRSCDDFLKLQRSRWREWQNHRDRKTQASGSFPHIISSH